MSKLFFETALLPGGWRRDVRVEVGADGRLLSVEAGAGADGAERIAGVALPGMPNLHSHAFQRAMAGLAERSGPGQDSFWSWRETMYGFLARLGPEDVQAIAAQLYVEMLKAGYTSVAEFHYLHHAPDGRPYDNPAELAERIAAAAGEAGIAMTMLPVLYCQGGFGGRPPGEGQRRFVNAPDAHLEIVRRLRALDGPNLAVGAAAHSLRAVTAGQLDLLCAGVPEGPLHIHVAEQEREVEDCLAATGARPVEYLFGHAEVDARWCLVHATHMSEAETRRLAASGAVAGLCPTTEANLGDGLFPAPAYVAAGGRFGIGSDSHVSVSPVEELRWLEYGQRLTARRRNLLSGAPHASTGMALLRAALAGGAQALGRDCGALRPGAMADLIVLDDTSPILAGRQGDALIDSWLFSGNANPVRHVYVAGRRIVTDGRHPEEARIARRYAESVGRLMA